MSTQYKKLEIQQFASNRIKETAEQRYWKQFKNPIESLQVARVTHINFCPSAPHNVAVSSSTRVLLYEGSTGELVKTISRFSDIAYSGAFRPDGKLVVAGCANGVVQIFDANSRLILRTFKGHSGPVQATKFGSDNFSILTGGDDKTVRRWDMPSDTQVALFEGHTDYVRSVYENPSDPNMFITGSYDHSIRCWDLRSNECVLTMDHGAPVEDVLCLPGGGLMVSAGDNQIRIWDVLAGGRTVHSLSNHQKTITGLSVDATSSRLLTGSLDQHVKFYDLVSYKVTHSIKFPSPILCMGISPNNNMLAVGMLSGALAFRRRVVKSAENGMSKQGFFDPFGTGRDSSAAMDSKGEGDDEENADGAEDDRDEPIDEAGVLTTTAAGAREAHRQTTIKTGSYRYFIRGANHKAGEDDFRVDVFKKQKLKEYDVFLKKFQYRDALDAALKTRHAVVVSSLMDELIQRGALRIALANRDESTLSPLIKFVTKYISNAHYSEQLIDVANMLFDIYGSVIGNSVGLDELFLKLRQELNDEIALQKQLAGLLGSIDMILSSASTSTPIQVAAPADPLETRSDATVAAMDVQDDAVAVADSNGDVHMQDAVVEKEPEAEPVQAEEEAAEQQTLPRKKAKRAGAAKAAE